MFLRIKNNLYRKKFFWQLKRLLENSIIFRFWRQIFSSGLNFKTRKYQQDYYGHHFRRFYSIYFMLLYLFYRLKPLTIYRILIFLLILTRKH